MNRETHEQSGAGNNRNSLNPKERLVTWTQDPDHIRGIGTTALVAIGVTVVAPIVIPHVQEVVYMIDRLHQLYTTEATPHAPAVLPRFIDRP